MTTSPTSETFGGSEGSAVPTVSAADLQKAYDLVLQNHRQHVITGIDVLSGVCSPGADVKAISFRVLMLSALVNAWSEMGPGSPFTPYQDADHLDAAVFRVAARAPLRWLRRSVGFPFGTTAEDFFGEIQKEQQTRITS